MKRQDIYFHLIVDENQDLQEVIKAHKKKFPQAIDYTVLRQDRLNETILAGPNDPYFCNVFYHENPTVRTELDRFEIDLNTGRREGKVCVFKITDRETFLEFYRDMKAEPTHMHKQYRTRGLMMQIEDNSLCYHKKRFVELPILMQMMISDKENSGINSLLANLIKRTDPKKDVLTMSSAKKD